MYGPSRSPITLPRGAPWLALLAAAACTDRPTAPLPGGAPARRVVAAAGVILPVDLGTLPGASESEATYVTDDGAVYGYSGGRAFRWTAAGGMTEVSSIPAPCRACRIIERPR